MNRINYSVNEKGRRLRRKESSSDSKRKIVPCGNHLGKCPALREVHRKIPDGEIPQAGRQEGKTRG